MKKLFALLVALVGSIGLLSSCGHKTETPTPTPTPETPEVTPTPTQPAVSEDLKKAQEFVKSIYQASEGNVTVNMDRAAKVPVNGKEFTVSWAVTVKSGNAEAVSVVKAEDNSKYVVNITYNNTITEEVKFTLTATITSAENESVTLDFEYTIPKFQANTVNQMLTEKDETGKVYFLEGIVTAINNVNGKDSFVLSDATGSIFCYEKKLDIRLGQKIQITGNYGVNSGYPQISNVSLVQVMSENNDVVAASGTPVVTTVEEINTKAKAADSNEALAPEYIGKYLEVTGYVVLSGGYANFAIAADQPSCCNLYANADINLKQYAGTKVVLRGFARGVSKGNGITIQVQSATLAEGEKLPTPEDHDEPAVTAKTLAELIAIAKADEMKAAYTTSFIVKGLGQYGDAETAGDYGNFIATDGNGNDILVYGATATASALTWDRASGTYGFKNPKDFMTNELTKNIVVGDTVKALVVRTSYGDKLELYAIILEVTPAHTHAAATEWSKDATHHWHACAGCDELLDKAEHTWNAGEVTTAPTETTAGVKTFTCTVCSGTKTEAVAPLEHTHAAATEWSKDATHHWHACAGCEEPVQLDKAEHVWNEGEVTTAPTVEAEGVKTFTCTVCGSTAKTESIEKLPKPLPEGAVVPVVGTAYRLGLVQGKLENKVYYITGAMSTFYLATTETLADGGDVYLEETTNGYYMYVMVGTTKNYINVERALGSDNKMHDNVKLSTTASTVWTYSTKYNTVITVIEEDTLYLGTRSDKTYTTVGPVKANNYSPFACYFFAAPVVHTHTPATEWSKDETHHWHACGGCTELLDKVEHSWVEGTVQTPATEEAEGLRIDNCECGATKEVILPKLTHEHSAATEWSKDETHHWHACATCETEVQLDKAEHTWGEGVITTQPTTFKEGKKTYTCECGKTKTEVIAKVNVELPEGAVVPTVGTAYKFGLIQEKVSKTNVYYITGAMASTYYFGTTTKLLDGCDVYLEETTGGYHVYAMISGAKKYINVVQSGTHTNSKYEATAKTVWTYSSQLNTIVTPINGVDYFIGTDSSKTFTTLGPVSANAFIAHFYNGPTDAEKVELDRLNVVDERKITNTITLEEKGKYGSIITWVVKEGNAISWNETDKKWDVQQPSAGSGDATVVLTATLTLNDATATVDVTVTVEDLLTDAELVALDLAAIKVAEEVTEDFKLPVAGANGTTISWVVKSGTAITVDGANATVVVPAEEDTVVLTATVELGEASESKDFTVVVPAEGAAPFETIIPSNLTFTNIANKASADSYWKSNYSDWTIGGKLGQGYGGYSGFGRSGDAKSSITSTKIQINKEFTITTVLKGNGSNGVSTSYLEFTLLDAEGEIVATGSVKSDSTKTNAAGTTKVAPKDGVDSTIEIQFTLVEGKSWTNVNNLKMSFTKVTGNIGLKSLTWNVA